MKTAISLPDELGHAADLFAAQRDMSRSELYAKALAEYLQRHKHEDLTEKINAVLGTMDGDKDASGEFGVRALRDLEW